MTAADTAQPAPIRAQGKRRITPASTGTADPRPLTEYLVDLSTVEGNTWVTIKLGRPCIIREPAWAFIDCVDGSRVYAALVKIDDHASFSFVFDGELSPSVAFVEVPYQDMQVQNFQGGFVRPGGRWFRTPVI